MRKVAIAAIITLALIGTGVGLAEVLWPTSAVAGCIQRC
jgi:hypothetical protein